MKETADRGSRPDLPRRFAAKIRAAQERVLTVRRKVLYDEKCILDDANRLAEFQADAMAYADKYYPGHLPDSYPVATNIERCAESLKVRVSRRGSRASELANAEGALEALEAGIADEVARIRPSRGRTLWPSPLPSLEDYANKLEEARRREYEAFSLARAHEQTRANLASEEADKLFSDTHERETQRSIAGLLERDKGLDPMQKELERRANAELLALLKSERISFADILSVLRAR